jgi:hypothetical protein
MKIVLAGVEVLLAYRQTDRAILIDVKHVKGIKNDGFCVCVVVRSVVKMENMYLKLNMPS